MLGKETDISGDKLITAALAGNKKSLELLIKRYQDYIYNISLRLFLHPDDALDATQEVLIKIVTSLKTFKGKSKFSTWVYRIAVNHFLNTPKRRMEILLSEKPESYSGFSTVDSHDKPDEAMVEEVRILCATAMLMCLNREQRLFYIIGEVFEADHQLGAALFDISPTNYRVKLHRAKADLLSFVSGKCGLVNPENPCRCPKKTRTLIDRGVVDPQELKFNADFQLKINDLVAAQKDEVSDKIGLDLKELFQDSPFQVKKELDEFVNGIVK